MLILAPETPSIATPVLAGINGFYTSKGWRETSRIRKHVLNSKTLHSGGQGLKGKKMMSDILVW